jgi:amino acid transporter
MMSAGIGLQDAHAAIRHALRKGRIKRYKLVVNLGRILVDGSEQRRCGGNPRHRGLHISLINSDLGGVDRLGNGHANLSIDQIIAAKDYSLAEASSPALGQFGFYFTVALAAVATASGVLASVFAVSRMLAMLTDMKMIPHRHFGMPGTVRSHTLVYTVVLASMLAVFFDLSRIASLGAFFYLIMDMLVHWGVFRSVRREIGANGAILLCALGLDATVLAAFTIMKLESDPMIVLFAAIAITAVFIYERFYLSRWTAPQADAGH